MAAVDPMPKARDMIAITVTDGVFRSVRRANRIFMTIATSKPEKGYQFATATTLYGPVGIDHGPPHVCHRTVIKAEAFRRLFELTSNDVNERVNGGHCLAAETVIVV